MNLLNSKKNCKFRIAPTPSGLLHEGNILNFLHTWIAARKCGASLLLRIDDCDATRLRKEYIEDIFRSLEWLDFDWDEGPRGPDDFYKFWSQSLRRERYLDVLSRIKGKFACQCSRREIHDVSPDGHYPGTCRKKGLVYEPGKTCVRLETDDSPTGDIILWRKDDLPAYQLVSVVDDVDYKITHIIRGEDLQESTQMQKIIATRWHKSEFLNIHFTHHPLLLDEGGKKLAKSANAHSIKVMRDSGKSPAWLFKRLAPYLGYYPENINQISDFLKV